MKSIPHTERGSVLLIALVFAIAIGISLASFVKLGQTNLEIANRAFYNNAAMDLAETGLEHAIWSLNTSINTDATVAATAWSDWTFHDSKNAWSSFDGGDYGQNTTGSVRVYLSNLGMTTPKLVARATITPSRGAVIEKWIEVDLKQHSRYDSDTGKWGIVYSGTNPSYDAWDSERNSDGSFRGSPVPYSEDERQDDGSIGSPSIAVDAVLIKNADIWGNIVTGEDDPSDSVYKNGSVLGEDSAKKDKSTWTYSNVDPDHVSTDFKATIDPEPMPPLTTAQGSITDKDLPTTLGEHGKAITYTYSSITATSGSSKDAPILTINGDVTLLLTADEAIKMTSGTGGIYVPTGSSLKIYTAGDITIAGNGIINGTPSGTTLLTSEAQPAKNVRIYGTAVDAPNDDEVIYQDIKITGNGALSAVIDAPTAAVTINGNGDVMGAVIGGTITFSGNAEFHKDLALTIPEEDDPYRINNWKELTTAEQRAAWASSLSF